MRCPECDAVLCPVCNSLMKYMRMQYLKEGDARYYRCPECDARIRITDPVD